MKKKRALVIGSFPAPYRVEVFHEMTKQYDLEIYFSTANNENRNTAWFPDAEEYSFQILEDPRARENFAKALKNLRQYDFIMPYDAGEPASMRVIAKCRLRGIPYFINCDGAILRKNFLRDRVKHFLYSGAAGCFSSGATADAYFQYYGVKPDRLFRHTFTSLHPQDVLDQPIESSRKRALREELGLPDKRLVISVGRFIPVKGYSNLIEAWKAIPDAHLLLIGGGEEKEKYEARIKELQIDNITILDFKPKEILKKYYMASDVFVLSTLGDVWGLVVNEAMACGLPVVTTHDCVAGVELIEKDRNGYLVDSHNVKEMSDALRVLIDDEQKCLEMGKNNIQLMQNATIEQIAANHIRAIESVLQNRK